MNATERRQRVRAWMAGDRCIFAPDVYDPLGARVAEDLGFELASLSAHAAEWMVNGGSELCRVTITELADWTRRICRSSDLSTLVSGPFGFGNALNEMRYVEDLDSAGASIVCIGDQVLPLPFRKRTAMDPYGDSDGDIDYQPQVSVEEAVGKIRAGIAARQDPSLVIGARTNALMFDIPAAIRRIKAYEEAGAEIIWLTRATTAGIKAVHGATKLPLIIGGHLWSTTEWRNRTFADPEIRAFVEANGVRMQVTGNAHIRAVMKTHFDVLTALRDGSVADVERIAISKDKFHQVTRLSKENGWIKEFLN